MVGKPNPQAKTPRLVLEARNDSEKILIRKTKEILAEKGAYAIDIVKDALEGYVKEHWPPNPQLQIPQFTDEKLPFSPETLSKLDNGKELPLNQKLIKCEKCRGKTGNTNCPQCAGLGTYSNVTSTDSLWTEEDDRASQPKKRDDHTVSWRPAS